MQNRILMRFRTGLPYYIDNITITTKEQLQTIKFVVDHQIMVQIGNSSMNLLKSDFTFNNDQEDIDDFIYLFNDRMIGFNIYKAIEEAYVRSYF